MGLVLKYVIQTKAGTWHYRRRLPREVAPLIGQSEFKRYLGDTEREALRSYPKVNAEFERLVAEARRRSGGQDLSTVTPMELHRLAELRAQELAATMVHIGDRTLPGSDPEAADVIRESYLSRSGGREDPVEGRAVAILSGGGKLSRPAPTIEDARKLYLKERVGDDAKKTMELERVFKLVSEALQSDRTLVGLKREDAREVRDHMADGRKASSVDRYLNVVRAVVNHAIREFDLAGMANPFMNLEAAPGRDKAEPDRDKRRPYTEKEAKAVTARIVSHARPDLLRIWQIMEGTGCRIAEVAGLRVADVHLDHAIPHMTVEWHDERRIKNAVSRRNVPLFGTAFQAAKEAVEAANGGGLLFPAYGREGGPASASAALGKHVRTVVDDPKVGPSHSLRHLMKDRLRLAGISKSDQDIVLGHSSGSVGEDYGGDEARLKVAERALKAALGVESESK
ncbi:integrase [Mesorhizobium sp. M3A.F.Ca.ET.174.01.1.1]|uniref:site-specific integrase n=1 Tax=unclassified Mesorhizobium TaxID=325217 RepID=UPI0010936D48|nr:MULTISPECIES: site-specific integrase [unclassified Mesorhizobium]TGS84866.1 integrase [Mesorhizobium sp. M3A.F.Ca.ET.175.01.1.1]TGT23270.1 integrase [Mesorhizobium sp. M3A.F.Ca.ET.174.01.1.1]